MTGYTYGAVAGTGWNNSAGAYTFTAASTTGTASVTATNGAGATGSAATFTAQADSAAPTGGAFSANGTAATGGGSTSYLTSGTTLTINSRTDFSETQDSTNSGLASSTLTIASASLTGNTCGSYGAPTTITGTTSQTVSSGNCYQLTLTGTDNVGNTTTLTTTVKVDTTAPSAPSATGFSFSALNHAYWTGGTSNRIYVLGSAAGSFTVTASGATDPESGIANYTYNPIGGTSWSNSGGNYNFSAPTSGAGTANATNNAGLTGPNATFLAQVDSNAPTGGALTANGTPATNGGTTSYLTTGTTLTINNRTDYTETQTPAESGLASSTLTIKTATLTGNTCGSYSAPTTITGTTSQTVSSGNCYQLTLTGTDNVGNTDTTTTTVKVDTTAPSARRRRFDFTGLLANAYWPGQRPGRLLPGRRRGRLHGHGHRRHGCRLGRCVVHVSEPRRDRLVEQRRRLQLHERGGHPVRLGDRDEPGRPRRARARASRPRPTLQRRRAAPSRPTAPRPPAAARRATSPPGPRSPSTAAPTSARRRTRRTRASRAPPSRSPPQASPATPAAATAHPPPSPAPPAKPSAPATATNSPSPAPTTSATPPPSPPPSRSTPPPRAPHRRSPFPLSARRTTPARARRSSSRAAPPAASRSRRAARAMPTRASRATPTPPSARVGRTRTVRTPSRAAPEPRRARSPRRTAPARAAPV